MRWSDIVRAAGIVLVAGQAFAQSSEGPYVSASLVGDLLRRGSIESGGLTQNAGSGEALGFALRLGAPIGSAWGVELEFVRPDSVDREDVNGPLPLFTAQTLPRGPFGYRVRSSERQTTFASLLWARQALSSRVSLVYLGGVAFHRVTQESGITFERGLGTPAGPGIAFPIPASSDTRIVGYATRPVVGVEGRVGMTDHVALVASLRVHGLDGGLLVRPSVGLSWTF